MALTHGSLFSGIGGFDLGFSRVGIETVFQVECDPYCLKVLEKNWPDVKRYADVRSVHGVLAHAQHAGLEGYAGHGGAGHEPGRQLAETNRPACSGCLPSVDLISGGFPCQPFSVAGKRRGTADDRHLWPEMRRVIAEVQPRWVVAENVPGLITLALDAVLSDLEALGYTTGAVTVPACAVDAPHRRERLWIVAHTEQHRCPTDYGRQFVSDQDGNDSSSSSGRTMQQSGAPKTGADVADAQRVHAQGCD